MKVKTVMIKFFKICLNYKISKETYIEPSKNITEILQNILKYELFLDNTDQQVLTYFQIIKK